VQSCCINYKQTKLYLRHQNNPVYSHNSQNGLQRKFYFPTLTSVGWLFALPTFQCIICGKKTRQKYELSCTGDIKRNVEKAPWCCGKEMIESIDD